MNQDTAIIEGNLAKDPRTFQHSNGPGVELRVIETPRVQDDDGAWRDGKSIAHTVVAWGALASRGASLRKGDRVLVVGETYIHRWTDDDKERTAERVRAEHLGLSLRFAPVAPRPDEPMGHRQPVRSRPDTETETTRTDST